MAKNERGALTIYDVAREARVSAMTVSRVINGGTNVKDELKKRVQSSIKSLGYSVNVAAQSTRARIATIKLGILYANPSAHFLNEVLVGSLEQTSKLGSQLILERCADSDSADAAVERLLKQDVEGVILPPPFCDSDNIVRRFRRHDIHVLSLASAIPMDEVSAVRIDDFQAAITMTRYLIRLGHRRIAFIKGDARHTSSIVRYHGFTSAMQNAGVAVDESLVMEGLYTYQSGLEAAQSLLRRDDPPTAIFASNDDMAAAVLGVAHGMQLRIPEDLSVCGFDDTLVATATWPQITTIHQPIADMGRAAVSTLVEKIREFRLGKPAAPKHELMTFGLMERGTTGLSRDNSIVRSTGQGGILPR